MSISQKKPLPEGLMGQLHGKGSMSEVLRIERQRLMEQAAEEMRAQLGGAAVSMGPVVVPKAAAAAAVETAPPIDTYQPSKLPMQPARRSQEGLSKLSRFVGDDLSEFVSIITHSEQTVMAAPEWPTDPYYLDVNNTLPFSSQRDLLGAICRLTVGWGTFSCRITLSLLSSASGIRNAKTLRKWLADLQRRRHIHYVPVHGDLRGSIIELSPPEEVRSSIERGWRSNRMKF
ncbi:MAG TPA: hypothetical protein VMA31_00160 [Bryobacteraceae bacterium]|jgi:hypothetical protein|nr:hypothetical protein [Bryobacteraceae bacterium]